MNKVILMGNLTRDPELRHLPNNNSSVCNFGLAVNERWTDAQGQQQENVHFVECEAWNRQAEVIAEHFQKGAQILIDGSLKFEQWIDQQSGENRNRLKVRVQQFKFTGPRLDENGNRAQNTNGNGNRNGNGRTAPQNAAPAPTTTPTTDDDVPF